MTPKQLIKLGLCPLPVRENEKHPALSSWKEFESRFPTDEELQKWRKAKRWGIVCGKISGGLEVIDFDEKVKVGLFEQWKILVENDSWRKCTITKTPSGGFHLLYRCKTIQGNLSTICKEITGKYSMIETRGEGGFIMEPPAGGYTFLQGDHETIPEISEEERTHFLDCVRALNEDDRSIIHYVPINKESGRPGDEYNQKTMWDDVLVPHGWTVLYENKGIRYWKRPDKKDKGISATENYNGLGLLHVFSSSTELPAGKSYTKFHVYTLLNHKGDFKESARALAGIGYGQKDYGEEFAEKVTDGLISKRASEIKPVPIDWLWEGKIAKGKNTLIAGNPGLGKSQVSVFIAATVSNGALWPCNGYKAKKASVLILSAEDDPADTIIPRLTAVGADMDKVHLVTAVRKTDEKGKVRDFHFDLSEDLEKLSKKIDEIGDVGLIIIDPISAYLGETDSHKNAEVRALLSQLSALASVKGVAVISITHLNKTAGTDAMARFMGSLAFVAAARAAYMVAKDKDDETRRLFVPVKNNLAKDTMGLAFSIESWGLIIDKVEIETSKIVWESKEIAVSANDILSTNRSLDSDESEKIREAKDWLEELLGSKPEGVGSGELRKMAEDVGITAGSLYKAAKLIKYKTESAGAGNARIWKLA